MGLEDCARKPASVASALLGAVTLLAAAALLGMHAGPAAAKESTPPPRVPDPLPLGRCLERAASSNPDIALDEAGAEAARHRVRPAGSLEDPRFAYAALNLPIEEWDFDSSPMSGNQLELRQELPFPGLLGSRRKAASAAAAAARKRLVDRRLLVGSEVEGAWAALGYAQRALDITESNIGLLRHLAEIAETKYSVGAGLQQDVMRAQVDLTRLLEQRLLRIADVRSAEARLAALLDLGPDQGFPRTDELREVSPLPVLEPLLARLAETSPRLHALAQRIEEAERAQRAVQLESYPDVDVVVGYRIRGHAPNDPVSGQDFFSGGLSLRLPVDRGKWRGRIAERAALVRRARAAYRGEQARLGDRVRSAHADLQRADAVVDLLETGLLPQARQSLESSRSGYRVDKVDFLSLIDAQVKLFDAELSLVRAVADRRIAFASLEGAVGERLR